MRCLELMNKDVSYVYERQVERPLVTDEIKRFLIENKQQKKKSFHDYIKSKQLEIEPMSNVVVVFPLYNQTFC